VCVCGCVYVCVCVCVTFVCSSEEVNGGVRVVTWKNVYLRKTKDVCWGSCLHRITITNCGHYMCVWERVDCCCGAVTYVCVFVRVYV